MSAAGFMAEMLATYHHSAARRERKRSLLSRGGVIALEPLKSPTIGGVRPASLDRVEHRASFGRTALCEHVLDPRPSRARRSNVGSALEPALQTVEPGADDVDAGERSPIERGVALGAERSDAERHRNAPRELGRESNALVDVGVGLSGEAHHQVELE